MTTTNQPTEDVEADHLCPVDHRTDRYADPCGACTELAKLLVADGLEMYEGPWDPEDIRHMGFADGWYQAWRRFTGQRDA